MELTKKIVVALTERVQQENYGGRNFSPIEFYEEESETIPANMDPAECEEVHAELRRRVEKRIAERKKALVDTLKHGEAPF